MEIQDAELGRMTAEAGLTVGDITTGEIQLNGYPWISSDAVGTITLVATKAVLQSLFKTQLLHLTRALSCKQWVE